jgi:hypothetical protein
MHQSSLSLAHSSFYSRSIHKIFQLIMHERAAIIINNFATTMRVLLLSWQCMHIISWVSEKKMCQNRCEIHQHHCRADAVSSSLFCSMIIVRIFSHLPIKLFSGKFLKAFKKINAKKSFLRFHEIFISSSWMKFTNSLNFFLHIE